MKKNILIAGGAGFVGANLAVFLKKRLKGSRIICFDNLIRKGSRLNVERLKDCGIRFIKGDIRDRKRFFALKNVDCIIDCSAEPSVLAAYRDPGYTIDTNLAGTVNCLDLARREKADFIFLSTSRVYPIAPLEAIPFKEYKTRFDWQKNNRREGCSFEGINHTFPLNGVRSLYGASKLAAEHIALEYFDMFSIRGVINRFGIIAGPWQMGKTDQGIISFWIAGHMYQKKLSYIGFGGEGKQVRDALHIDDACELILYQLNHLKNLDGRVFNAGGGRRNSFSLCELTTLLADMTKTRMKIGSVKKNRNSDVRIYITDNSFVTKKTGWFPKKNLEAIVSDTQHWIASHREELAGIL